MQWKLFRFKSSKITMQKLSTQIYIWQQIHHEALHYCNQFYQAKFDLNKEKIVSESRLIKLLIEDIIASGEYTMEGISTYANIPFDLIIDLMAGLNNNPSFELSTKIIYLHTTVRREVYAHILKPMS